MTDLPSTAISTNSWSGMFTTESLGMRRSFFSFYGDWDYGFSKRTRGAYTRIDEEKFINIYRLIKTLTVSGSVMCVLLNSILVLSILFKRENRTLVFFPVLFQAVFDILGPGRREKINLINTHFWHCNEHYSD